MVEVHIGEVKAADLAKAKISELNQLKEANPLVNHEVFQKNGEIIVDFFAKRKFSRWEEGKYHRTKCLSLQRIYR